MAKLMVLTILFCTIIGINSQLAGSGLGLFGPPTGLPAWGPSLDLHGAIVQAQITKLGPLTPDYQARVDDISKNYTDGAAGCQTSLGPSAPSWLYRICVISQMKTALNEIKVIENELAAATTTTATPVNAAI